MGFLLAALVGGLLFFNTASPRKAEKMAEKVLHQRFPTAKVDVGIEGKRGTDTIKGRFRAVNVSMGGFTVAAPVAGAPGAPAPSPNLPVPNTLPEGTPATGAAPAGTPGNPGVAGLSLRAVADAEDKGTVGGGTILLQDFEYNNLRVEKAEISYSNVVFDWKALKKRAALDLVSVESAKADIVVPASSLERIVQMRMSDIKEAKVTLEGDSVRMSAYRPAPVIGTLVPFSLSAKLETRNGNEIWLANTQLSLGGVPLPGPLAREMLGKINPVYVFDRARRWPFRVSVTEMNSRENRLHLRGDLTFLPATAPATLTTKP